VGSPHAARRRQPHRDIEVPVAPDLDRMVTSRGEADERNDCNLAVLSRSAVGVLDRLCWLQHLRRDQPGNDSRSIWTSSLLGRAVHDRNQRSGNMHGLFGIDGTRLDRPAKTKVRRIDTTASATGRGPNRAVSSDDAIALAHFAIGAATLVLRQPSRAAAVSATLRSSRTRVRTRHNQAESDLAGRRRRQRQIQHGS